MEIGSHPPSTKEITERERPDGNVEELSRATAYYPSWEGRGNRQKKIVYTSRFVRVILAQGPC